MILLRRVIRLLLASFCYATGILTTITHIHQQHFELVIFMVSTFALGTSSVFITVFRSTRILISIQYVLCVYFFASSVMLVLILSKATNSAFDVPYPFHFHPIILTLLLGSMFIMGLSIAYEFTFDSGARHNSRERPNDVQPDAFNWNLDQSHTGEASPKVSDKTVVQTPSAYMNFGKSIQPEKILHNKDSEKTLVGPVVAREEDMTLKWLIQASMSANSLYDNQSENWMSSKLIRPAIENCNELEHAPQQTSPVAQTDSIHVSKTRGGHYKSKSLCLSANASPDLPLNHYSQPRCGKSSHYNTHTSCRSTNKIARQCPLGNKDSMVDIELTGSPVYNKLEHFMESCFDESNKRSKSRSLWGNDCANHGDDKSLLSFEKFQNFTDKERKLQVLPSSLGSQLPPQVMAPLQDSLVFSDGRVLRPAFEALSRSMSNHSQNTEVSGEYLLNGLESIPMVGLAWTQIGKNDSKMRNISLQDWDRIKDQWLQTHNDATPILISTIPDEKLAKSISAPSLHTFREKSDSTSRVSTVTPSTSNLTLHKCVTPPRQLSPEEDRPAPDSSPIKKIISRFKRRDSAAESRSSDIVKKHKGTHSIAASMISAASGISSRSGSPRKTRSSYFSRTSLDHLPNKPTGPNPPSLPICGKSARKFRSIQDFRVDNQLIPGEGFWDLETGDFSDKSRVSSVPSAIIGEYDREKWRTLKELKKDKIVL